MPLWITTVLSSWRVVHDTWTCPKNPTVPNRQTFSCNNRSWNRNRLNQNGPFATTTIRALPWFTNKAVSRWMPTQVGVFDSASQQKTVRKSVIVKNGRRGFVGGRKRMYGGGTSHFVRKHASDKLTTNSVSAIESKSSRLVDFFRFFGGAVRTDSVAKRHFLAVTTNSWATVSRETIEYFLQRTLQPNTLTWDISHPLSGQCTGVCTWIRACLAKFPAFRANSKTRAKFQSCTLPDGWNLVVSEMCTMDDVIPFECTPANFIVDIWTRLSSTSLMYVSRSTLLNLHDYFMNSIPVLRDPTPRPEIDFGSSQNMPSTSTSQTRVPIQTALVAARGSRGARYGGTRRIRYRRRVYVSDFQTSDWGNIIRYFSSTGYSTQYLESRGLDGGLSLRTEYLQVNIHNNDSVFNFLITLFCTCAGRTTSKR